MGNHNKHRKNPYLHPPTTKEGALARIRTFILDSQVADGERIALALGCPPISDEVLEREEYESDLRLDDIAHLIPILHSYSALLVEGYMKHQRDSAPPEALALGDEVWAETKRMLEQTSRAVLMGAVSQLVNMGHLRTRKKFRKND